MCIVLRQGGALARRLSSYSNEVRQPLGVCGTEPFATKNSQETIERYRMVIHVYTRNNVQI